MRLKEPSVASYIADENDLLCEKTSSIYCRDKASEYSVIYLSDNNKSLTTSHGKTHIQMTEIESAGCPLLLVSYYLSG